MSRPGSALYRRGDTIAGMTVRKILITAGLVALLAPVPAFSQASTASTANPPRGTAVSPTLQRVTLFTSGVAEFVVNAPVDGSAVVELMVDTDQMSDLVRSLTIADPAGNGTYRIAYPAGESMETRLGRFRVDLSKVETLTDLLSQARGTEIEIDNSAGETLSGRLVAVHGGGEQARRSTAAPDRDGTMPELVVQIDDRLVRVAMEEVRSVRPADGALQRDLARALDLLERDAGGSRSRPVDVHLDGNGRRTVTFRYLAPMPVWKTSYRAVLSGRSITLQGWAHLDNTSTWDWTDTEVRLVSSSPDSYFFDLYPPLYVAREQVLTGPGAAPPSDNRLQRAPMRSLYMDEAESALSDGAVMGRAREQVQGDQDVSGVELTIDRPVTLERGRSAMIPIVDRTSQAESVRSFDPRRDRTHPRLSVAFRNEGNLQLPGGAMTIFDGDRYVGDAVVDSLVPGARRTIPYARDLATTITAEAGGGEEELRTLRVVDGLLVAERRARLTTTYEVRAENQRTPPPVRITHPRRRGWDVVSPSTLDTTPDEAVVQSSGRRLAVVEEQIREQRYGLTSIERPLLVEFSGNRLTDPRVRRVLQNVLELRDQLERHREERAALEEEQSRIFSDQERLRGNMETLDRDSSLYRRYVNRLDDQETRLSFLREDLEEAREAEQQAEAALEAYLRTLNS